MAELNVSTGDAHVERRRQQILQNPRPFGAYSANRRQIRFPARSERNVRNPVPPGS